MSRSLSMRTPNSAWLGGGPVGLLVAAMAVAGLGAAPLPLRAGVRFDNCVQAADGSLSCDTAPTGNTYLNDKDSQYGVFSQASPGWNEFEPYQGYDQELGGGED